MPFIPVLQGVSHREERRVRGLRLQPVPGEEQARPVHRQDRAGLPGGQGGPAGERQVELRNNMVL